MIGSIALHCCCWSLATHIQGTSNLVALWGVFQATVHVPTAPTQCTHAKGAPYVVQDSVWAGLSAVLWLWLLLHGAAGLLLGSRCCWSMSNHVLAAIKGERAAGGRGRAVGERGDDLRVGERGATEERKGPANDFE